MNDEQIKDALRGMITNEPVMLFMKGTPDQPRCGFSSQVVQILNAMEVEYAALDILPDPRIRQELSSLSGWPTIPQLFAKGDLVGGCDIVVEMFESGELARTLGADQPAADAAPAAAPEDQPTPIQIEGAR
jgi:monothiol glutaredoxin